LLQAILKHHDDFIIMQRHTLELFSGDERTTLSVARTDRSTIPAPFATWQ
jgi:hypothetical protein